MGGDLHADDAQSLAFAERIADDEANVNPDEWTAVWSELDARTRIASSGPFDASVLLASVISESIHESARRVMECFRDVGIGDTIPLRLIREIFGNPFRPIDFAPWRTDTTTALAKGMYESRDFSAMPILADALQDAGCDNADVLIHCRDASAEHVRGCWVVDGVLGLA